MTSRRFPHDVPNRQPGMRRMDVRAYLGNNNYQVTMGDGTPQMAVSTGTVPYSVGASVLGYWSNASGVWVIVPNTVEQTTACAITLSKAWEFDTTSPAPAYTRMRVHPNGRWIAVVGTQIKVLDWSAESVVDTQSGTFYDIAFSPDGLWLAAAISTSPFVRVYPFDPDTGAIGTAVADPVTASPSSGGVSESIVRWHPSSKALFVATQTAAHLISGWEFFGGAFGARLTALAETGGWGATDNGQGHWAVILGIYTRSGSLSSITGFDVNPRDGMIVASYYDSNTNSFLSTVEVDIDSFYESGAAYGYRHDGDVTYSGPSPYTWQHPVISPDGSYVAAHAQNSGNVGGSNDIAEIAIYPLRGSSGLDYPRQAPRPGIRGIQNTHIMAGERDQAAWRPGRSSQQIAYMVCPRLFEGLAEPRIVLSRIDGGQFGPECTWAPEDADNILMDTDGSMAWHPSGDRLFVIPDTYYAEGPNVLLVLNVVGDP